MSARCHACGARIALARRYGGRIIAVDPVADDRGRVVATPTPDGALIRAHTPPPGTPLPAGTRRYTPHTCTPERKP